MPSRIHGRAIWNLSVDEEGHREYQLINRVETTDANDGPYLILNFTPGLPQPGDVWTFGNDVDPWAFCTRRARVTAVKDREPCKFWDVEQIFSTKWSSRCQDERIEDPILMEPKVSGSSIKYTEEAVFDRNGDRILSSSLEQLRGPQNEWDANRPQTVIEHNTFLLEKPLCDSMVDSVNDAFLWGYPPRSIKLSDFTWSRNYYGTCFKYYTRRFTFDFRVRRIALGGGLFVYVGDWDRQLLDEGTKVLRGHWGRPPELDEWILDTVNPPNPNNPADFQRFKDRKGENTRVILDGAGKPFDDSVLANTPGQIFVEKYEEANFLLLGLPLDI